MSDVQVGEQQQQQQQQSDAQHAVNAKPVIERKLIGIYIYMPQNEITQFSA